VHVYPQESPLIVIEENYENTEHQQPATPPSANTGADHCPSLIPAGVGEAIAARDCAKVLMLNGTRDRETTGMGVMDIVRAVTSSLNRQHARGASRGARPLDHPPSAYVTVVLAPANGEFDAEAARAELAAAGIHTVITVASDTDQGRVIYQPRQLVHALRSVVEAHRVQLALKIGYTI
jgi:cathepsin L